MGFRWFLGGARLRYLIEGVEVIVEVADITSEKVFPLEKTGESLHDWWLDELPQYVGTRPQGNLVTTVGGFHAALIADDEDEDAYTLGIAENEDGSGASLIFMRGQEEAKQGDSYCIVSPIGTHYGGIQKCEMSKSELRLVFDVNASEALGVGNVVNIDLSGIGRTQLALLDQGVF